MKIIFILDQIQAGLGGKEHGNQPLSGRHLAVGGAKMFDQHLEKYDATTIATLYCGDEFFFQDETTNALKLTAMCKKLGADVVVCGPCFNYENYGLMAAKVAQTIEEKTDIKAIAAMSVECSEAIEQYKQKVNIVKMPKKGGVGLTEALEKMLELCQLKVTNKDLSDFVKENCY